MCISIQSKTKAMPYNPNDAPAIKNSNRIIRNAGKLIIG